MYIMRYFEVNDFYVRRTYIIIVYLPLQICLWKVTELSKKYRKLRLTLERVRQVICGKLFIKWQNFAQSGHTRAHPNDALIELFHFSVDPDLLLSTVECNLIPAFLPNNVTDSCFRSEAEGHS
jgi:hypothetical protein